LRERASSHGLEGVVQFRPPIPREKMPEVLADHDLLVLASEYDEPLARAMQEGMAMGLLVIGTATGGSGELLMHEKTGLVFEPGDAESLAAQLLRARSEPDLARGLSRAGQRVVAERFDIRRTVEAVEGYFLGLSETGQGQP
jgi:glycogen(starch) synthase